MAARTIVLAAGGTGGHLFPASALGAVLRARGHRVVLITDARGARYDARFPADAIHVVPSDTVRGRNPVALAKTFLALGRGLVASRGHLRRHEAAAVVGFGGYPSLPPLFAARAGGVPIVLHEQNAVLGRANKAMVKAARKVGFGFPAGASTAPNGVHVGNPVRPEVLAARELVRDKTDRFDLLIFGGSQGARVFSDVVPAAVRELSPEERGKLLVTQQARAEDLERVREAYAKLDVAHDVAPFFDDLPARIAAADVVVGRAGASTVSELAVIGRPSVLVPLPHALDQDQAANARILEEAGGAVVLRQADFTPGALASLLSEWLADEDVLPHMAQAARGTARLDAADRLADLVEDVIAENAR